MLSISPDSLGRSSLEEMLDSLQRRDQNEKLNDTPPVLPPRPKPTSRARLPSAKRPLPTSFQIGEPDTAPISSNCNVTKEYSKGLRWNSFGAKKFKEVGRGESPYLQAASEEKCHKLKVEDRDNANLASPSPRSLPRLRESDGEGDVEYSIKKLHNGLWESGQIQSTSGEKASILLSDGSIVTVPTQELLPANPDILEGVDDLMQLSYLNEPSVLHNLQHRYFQGKVYSKTGPLLLAVNPFKDVQIYGSDFVTAYRKKLLNGPHVYAVADAAYNKMMNDEVSQSIIISGESGAGKTETAKIAMQYLTAVAGTSGGIESEVLQTSHILEAFGNAKTARNDNSSRFGKLIEIHYSASGKICGAKVQTFLLDKSRVVQLAQGDRSYHIFYQLCAGAPPSLQAKLRLKRASDYCYLNQSDCLAIHDVDDAQKFHMLMGALNTVRICIDDQENAFEMLAAVLWLGNISFLVIDNENHIEVVADEAVANAAALIGCGTQDLVLALSTHNIRAGKDAKRLTLQQAIDTRDSLAKFIYSSLFDWLVEKINLSLAMGKQDTGRSIGILDIYGFESFKKNSFEQFCINYADERLQQYINRYLFKLPQEEHELDGIDRTKIDLGDNRDCLDLFEKKPFGLISLLDEESNSPKATDLTFATKLKQHLNGNHCFKGERGGAFSVQHYAGEVIYDTGEFLEKNRDPLRSEILQLLSSCSSHLPKMFATVLKESQKLANSLIHLGMSTHWKPSVVTKFKDQLFKLSQQLESTTPHFIVCIKPNSKQVPGAFEKDLVLEQLRCYGVIEIVRIARSGYPTRMAHQEFARRYGFLLPENSTYQEPLSTSVAILQQFDILPEMYQVGFTKLYFRAGQIGALENAREQVLRGILEVQKCFRGHRARRYFHKLKGATVTLQSYVRGEIARKDYNVLLRLSKPVVCKKLDEQRMAVLQIQSVIRGWLVRRHISYLQHPKHSNVSKWKPGWRISEVKVPSCKNQDQPPELLPSVVEELQKRLLAAEMTLQRKEKENATLREQVQIFEVRWSEYQTKMKSMEEVWQKQIASLQTSLAAAAAEKSLGNDNTISQPGKFHGNLSTRFSDSEDMCLGPKTPGGISPVRFLSNRSESAVGGDTNGGINPVSTLVDEFEERKQNFDDEAQVIMEVKPGRAPSMNLLQELQRLKHKFKAWKKDYKFRLRKAKAKVQKLGHAEIEKHRWKWWGRKT